MTIYDKHTNIGITLAIDDQLLSLDYQRLEGETESICTSVPVMESA